MKFYVGTKEKGEKVKKQIRTLVSGEGYISVARIDEICFGKPIKNGSDYYGWSFEDVRKKMRLRETKAGWYLYFPKTIDLPFWDAIGKIPESEIVEFTNELGIKLEKELGVRCCRTVHKKNGKIVEEFGFCHGVFQSSKPNKDGQLIQQALWAVELVDGATCDVTSGHIIFGWED